MSKLKLDMYPVLLIGYTVPRCPPCEEIVDMKPQLAFSTGQKLNNTISLSSLLYNQTRPDQTTLLFSCSFLISKMDVSGECSSGCESGWTLYLEHSNRNHNFVEYKQQHQECYYDYVEEDEEDLSMVSDASSGPPHFIEDDQQQSSKQADVVTTTLACAKSQKRKKDQQQKQSFLDDTASSHVVTFSSKVCDVFFFFLHFVLFFWLMGCCVW